MNHRLRALGLTTWRNPGDRRRSLIRTEDVETLSQPHPYVRNRNRAAA